KLGFFATNVGVLYGSAAGLTTSAWYHLTWTISGTTMTFYVNGIAKGTATAGARSTSNGAATLGQTASLNWVKDALDEPRLSNIARSAEWIAAEYYNQSSPSTFYSISNASTVGGGGGGSTSAQIHWLVTDQLGTPRMNFDQSGSL